MIQKETLTALGIPSAVYDFCHIREKALREQFERIEEIAEANQAKVLAAFQIDFYVRVFVRMWCACGWTEA